MDDAGERRASPSPYDGAPRDANTPERLGLNKVERRPDSASAMIALFRACISYSSSYFFIRSAMPGAAEIRWSFFAGLQDRGHQGSHHTFAPAGLKKKTLRTYPRQSLRTPFSLNSLSSQSLRPDTRWWLSVPFVQRLRNISNALETFDFEALLDLTGPCSTASFFSLAALRLSRPLPSLLTTCLSQFHTVHCFEHQTSHFEEAIYRPSFHLLRVLKRLSHRVEHSSFLPAAEARLAELSDSAQHFGRLGVLRAFQRVFDHFCHFQPLPHISSHLLLSKSEFPSPFW